MVTETIRSTLRVPEVLMNSLKVIAKQRGCTLNGLIREILWDWVHQNEPPCGGSPGRSLSK